MSLHLYNILKLYNFKISPKPCLSGIMEFWKNGMAGNKPGKNDLEYR
jgi:hypothetical protein